MIQRNNIRRAGGRSMVRRREFRLAEEAVLDRLEQEMVLLADEAQAAKKRCQEMAVRYSSILELYYGQETLKQEIEESLEIMKGK